MPGKSRKQKPPPGPPFDEDDPVGPFRWAAAWKIGQPSFSANVPDWVLEYFLDLAARYWFERKAALREGRRPPTLDELAGLSGVKTNAWKAANRLHKAHLLKHFFDSIIQDVRSGQRGKALHTALLIRHNMFTDGKCPPVPVLDKRGRPTRAFQIALGRCFNVVLSPDNVTEEAIYLAVRRLLREASAAPAANIDK